MKPGRILAIETSCDETACAVLEDGHAILSSVVASQMDVHARYGGVFPEVASRQHVLTIVPVVEEEASLGVGYTRARKGEVLVYWIGWPKVLVRLA